jgi:hypothetical protein
MRGRSCTSNSSALEVHARVRERAQLALLQGLVEGLLHEALARLAPSLVAVQALDHRGGHLAGTEALDARLAPGLGQDLLQLGAELVGRDGEGHARHQGARFLDLDLHGRGGAE